MKTPLLDEKSRQGMELFRTAFSEKKKRFFLGKVGFEVLSSPVCQLRRKVTKVVIDRKVLEKQV